MEEQGKRVFALRKAVPEDALGITIVNVYTWKTTYTGLIHDTIIDVRIEKLKQRAEKCKCGLKEDDRTIVATMDQTIVGFCTYGKSRNEDYETAGEIYALYVLHGLQGMKIGKALFLAGVRELVSEGYDTMILNCLQKNPSLAFYKHMGGKVVGQRQDSIEEGCICEDIVYYDQIDQMAW